MWKSSATCQDESAAVNHLRLWIVFVVLLLILDQSNAFNSSYNYRRPQQQHQVSSSSATTLSRSSSICVYSRKSGQHHHGVFNDRRTTRIDMLSDGRNGEVDHHYNGQHQKEQSEKDNATVRQLPRHIAFICDGNSRWAHGRGLPTAAGHWAGADRLIDCLQTLKRTNGGVQYCTFYGFSTENWKRPPDEIRDVLRVMEHTARKFYSTAIDERVRVRILGDLHDPRIPMGLRNILQQLEQDTFQYASSLTVCIAVNYGGRQDIVNASLRLAQGIASGELNAEEVAEDVFSSLLVTSDIPDPDLVIRTGGERRLSNFLLWNCAYSELYFVRSLWPDFDEQSMLEALDWYSSRSRRFGGRKESKKPAASTSC